MLEIFSCKKLVVRGDRHESVKAAPAKTISERWRREPPFFTYIELGSIRVLG